MKVAIIGVSGKTGKALLREGLNRGFEVIGVCRPASAGRLEEFVGQPGFTVKTAPVVADEAVLTEALVGCDAVAAILISVKELKATDLVKSLAKATVANEVHRLVFTAGEITAVREEGEKFTFRQKIMSTAIPPLLRLTPFSVSDMLHASVLVREQPEWEWTIVRAPSLIDAEPRGYRLGGISEVTGSHKLARADYAACLLDSLQKSEHYRRTLTVLPVERGNVRS